MLDDRGLCVQEGQGTGAPGVLQGTFRAVPGDGRAVQPGVLAAGPAGAHASPLPLQLCGTDAGTHGASGAAGCVPGPPHHDPWGTCSTRPRITGTQPVPRPTPPLSNQPAEVSLAWDRSTWPVRVHVCALGQVMCTEGPRATVSSYQESCLPICRPANLHALRLQLWIH